MKFDTSSQNCLFNYGERELSFLVYQIREVRAKEYGSFDPAAQILHDILDILLSLNEFKTLEFLESIEDENDFEIISNRFVGQNLLIEKLQTLRGHESEFFIG